MFKKYPEKIIKGTMHGPDRASAAFPLGATADRNDPLIIIILINCHFLNY